jgi:hypothetical protein
MQPLLPFLQIVDLRVVALLSVPHRRQTHQIVEAARFLSLRR